MRLKKLTTGETASLYVISEAYQSEINNVGKWLEEHCPGEYKISGQYVFITPKYEILFALTFVGQQA